MPGHVEVRGRVPVRRVFTASDVIAFLAELQVRPVLASRTRPTVVAVTVSGGDLILVIRGPG